MFFIKRISDDTSVFLDGSKMPLETTPQNLIIFIMIIYSFSFVNCFNYIVTIEFFYEKNSFKFLLYIFFYIVFSAARLCFSFDLFSLLS